MYLGEDTRLNRKVAVKVLPEEFAADPERLARFEQEAKAAAALNPPHIAAVFDVGFEEGGAGVHYIVQEYLEGDTLRVPLDRGALPIARALTVGREIAAALGAAHAAGIVHRDLKPGQRKGNRSLFARFLSLGRWADRKRATAQRPYGNADVLIPRQTSKLVQKIGGFLAADDPGAPDSREVYDSHGGMIAQGVLEPAKETAMRLGRGTLLLVVIITVAGFAATSAAADTVYLKNGRVMRSSMVRVEGDRVYVRLYGGEVSFPMSMVERIEEDNLGEPPPTVVPVPAPAPDDPSADPADPSQDDPADPSPGDPAQAGADPAADSPPEQTRDYWQNRLQPLKDELERLDGVLVQLRSSNAAAVQPQINRAEASRGRAVAQIDVIMAEARRLGVPAGWLR